MRIALLERNKLGFIDGTWKKDSFKEESWCQGERCNAIVQSWLMNTISDSLLGGMIYVDSAQEVWEDLKLRFDNLHKEIATLVQGTSYVAAYLTRMKKLWVELEAIVPPPRCNCEKSREFLVYYKDRSCTSS